jgi:hypothetical protein
MKKKFVIWIIILLSVAALGGFTYAEDGNAKISAKDMTRSEAELRASMSVLWESRATLLRAYIVSELGDSKEKNEIKDKLIKNAGDLGTSIKPYYGGIASFFLTNFLKKDVELTEQVINAAKKGNKEAMNLTDKAKWKALDLTDKAKEKALEMTKKAKEKALNLTETAKEKALNLAKNGNEKFPDLAEKAREEALGLAKKAREEALDLTKKAREEALGLTKKAREEALSPNKKFNREALDLITKARNIALDLIMKAKEIALDLIMKAKEIALELTEKTKEIALELTEKTKEEDLELAKNKWYDNARSLAGFFAIPRNQTKKDLTDILYKHLDLTWGEIEAILAKDEVKDLECYEKDKAHMAMFSGVLTDGIVKQFPRKFKD